MAQKKREPGPASRYQQRTLFGWLRAKALGDADELDPTLDELLELDPELAETVAGKNGRPKSKKWVLIR